MTNREIAQREELYSEFIRQGTGCYAKALSQNLNDIDAITTMYALVNGIRLFASSSVLEAADAFVKNLVQRYGEKNMGIDQITSFAIEQHLDPLNDFALKCRLIFAICMRNLAGGSSSEKRPRVSSSSNLDSVPTSFAVSWLTVWRHPLLFQ
jgi:hypothetical protein